MTWRPRNRPSKRDQSTGGVSSASQSRLVALYSTCSTVYAAMAVKAGTRDLPIVDALTVPQMIKEARIPVRYFIYSYLC